MTIKSARAAVIVAIAVTAAIASRCIVGAAAIAARATTCPQCRTWAVRMAMT
jgi:hypothetical protein